jgi:hypothetical protein
LNFAPRAANRRAQQRRFDEFRREYNHDRPHEALGMRPPSAGYAPSPRPYPARVPNSTAAAEPFIGCRQRFADRKRFSTTLAALQ